LDLITKQFEADSVADPDPGSGIRYFFYLWVRDPASGMGKKSRSGIRDEHFG
jgi:hypothetical protein